VSDAGAGSGRGRDRAVSGRIGRVCVFCGSAQGEDPRFVEAARATGSLLARRGLELVYGGGHIGMMGALADAALSAGGHVTGVIPRSLMRPEVAHAGLSELLVVDSMQERKRLMADRADCFLVLPGGYGTLDETFEMVTALQLGLQRKPLALVNIGRYFDPLLRWVQHAVECGFVQARHGRLLPVADTSENALELLESSLAKDD
jgi:uncharacterized protein (TIGR00730 family)